MKEFKLNSSDALTYDQFMEQAIMEQALRVFDWLEDNFGRSLIAIEGGRWSMIGLNVYIIDNTDALLFQLAWGELFRAA
jgi:hypothetical protein